MSETLSNSVLDRVLDPFTACLTPEVAKRIAGFQADPETQARVDELADKANEAALSDQQKAEYRQLVEALDILTILQAKARSFLDKQPSS